MQEDEQPTSRAGLARAVVLRYGHLLRKHWASFQRDVSDFNVLQVWLLRLLLGVLCSVTSVVRHSHFAFLSRNVTTALCRSAPFCPHRRRTRHTTRRCGTRALWRA